MLCYVVRTTAHQPEDQLLHLHHHQSVVLITCGGEFDRSVHRYKQNVVVVATPAS